MRILSFLILLILITQNLLSQSLKLNSKPVKKNNLIVIITSNKQTENYQSFSRFLIANGYTLENKDAEFFTLRTNPKRLKYEDYILNVAFEDTVIVIRSEWSTLSISPFGIGTISSKWSYTNFIGDKRYSVYKDFYPILQKYNYPIYFTTEK